MKYHTQTILHEEGKTVGNCFQTVIACIFDLEIEDVPNFINGTDDHHWYTRFQRWCLEHGYFPVQMVNHDVCKDEEWHEGEEVQYYELAQNCICEACIRTDRGTLHSVIIQDGKVVHDPHPSKANLGDPVSKCRNITAFVKTIPSIG